MVDDMTAITDSIDENRAKFDQNLSNSSMDIANKAIELNSTRDDRVANRNNWIDEASSAIQDALNMEGFDYSELGNNVRKYSRKYWRY